MTTPDEVQRAVERLEENVKRHSSPADYAFVKKTDIRLLLSERADLLATVQRMRGTIEMANNIANGYYTSYEFDAEDTVRRLIDVLSGEDK